MKKVLVLAAAAAVLAIAAPASAADMPVKGPLLSPTPSYSWAGFYVGVHAGHAWADRNGCWDFGTTVDCAAGDFTDTFSYRQSGWLAGAQGGYNWMFSPNWLFGVEVDASTASIRGTLPGIAGGVGTWNWLASATAKIGWVSGQWLLYAKGGYALGEFNFAGNSGCNFKSSHSGPTAGLGVAMKISPRASVNLEYSHLWLNTNKEPCTSFGFIPTAVETRAGMDVVKLGLNLQLGN